MNSSAPEVTVRTATAQDAEAITRIYIQSADHHANIDAERYCIPPEEFILERYRTGGQHVAGSEASTLVAEAGGQLLGFADIRLNQSTDPMHKDLIYCHIVEIAVREDIRSQGIGERLMRAAEDWGRDRGAELMSLEYNGANKRAAQFYNERMGYRAASIMAIKRL
jgi:ribosomal protein S18 acetylase RimI-like enzyme